MNTITEKLKKAQELNESIQIIESFIELAHKAQEIDEKNAKYNELNGVNTFIGCQISAYISTGSQSPRYEKTIKDNDVIVGLMTGGLSVVKEMLKDKKEELSKIIN
jgi:hypothetical protein